MINNFLLFFFNFYFICPSFIFLNLITLLNITIDTCNFMLIFELLNNDANSSLNFLFFDLISYENSNSILYFDHFCKKCKKNSFFLLESIINSNNQYFFFNVDVIK